MSSSLFHYNENVVFNVEHYGLDASILHISGWIFSEVPVIRVDFALGENPVLVGPLLSYGQSSSDVERHYGPTAANCRFDESIQIPSRYSVSDPFIFTMHFATGVSRAMTFKHSRSMNLSYRDKQRATLGVRLGIGITTYKRKESLKRLLEKLELHTQADFCLIVADDGSEDGTVEMLDDLQVPYITGSNRGVAWNKNRALYYLNAVMACDITILLEDDTYPSLDGWEADWIQGGLLHGHLNLAGHWFKERFLNGLGTVESPIISVGSSGQCVCFSRKTIERVGYFDTRFGRYGFEHIEHTERCIKLGYGGRINLSTGTPEFFLIRGGVTVGHMMDFHFSSLIPHNAPIYEMVKLDELHRWAWRGDDEMRVFLLEQDQASSDGCLR